MISPKYLQKNDTIAIVSTARKISLEEIKPAIELLESWKLNVRVGKTIGLENNQFAGTDEERINDFQKMLDDDSVKAIWCTRGGYGTVRIIDLLDFSGYKRNPKWIIGYSDVTVLHSHIHNMGFETLHASMPINIPKNTGETLNSLKDALNGNELSYTIKSNKLNKPGSATGQLVGGNLSILYSLLGSETSVDTSGKILFIEDLDEYLYHVDRMMQNLRRNGYFDKLKGLIVGSMTEMNDNTIPFGKTAKEIIFEICKEYDFPICFNFPAGHIDDNRTLILGRSVQLVVDSAQSIVNFYE
jgi:muramoyltetrapeptide carboxypeptidase